MHLHVGAMEFLVFAAYSIIFGFFVRLAAARYADKPLGQALAFIA